MKSLLSIDPAMKNPPFAGLLVLLDGYGIVRTDLFYLDISILIALVLTSTRYGL
jgi:hypothetical protein